MSFVRIPTGDDVAGALKSAIQSKRADGHTCNVNTCTVVNLNVRILKGDDQRYYIKSKYLPPVENADTMTTVCDMYSIYLCKKTGKVHYCHRECDGDKISNDDNCIVCCISGIQYQSEVVRSWKITSRCTAAVIANKEDPYKFSRDSDGRVKSGSVHNMTTAKCIQCCRQMVKLLLFSEERMANEVIKHRDIVSKAEKLVNKYKRHCEKNKVPIVYIHAYTIYINSIQSRPTRIHLLQKSDEEIERMVDMYTKKVISYWRLILYHTNARDEMRTSLTFKAFIPSCLYLLKNGIRMNGVYILEKCDYLDAALPEANYLDVYGINKPSFTQTKNSILLAIRETIEKQKETPTSMRDYADEEYRRLLDT